MGENGILGRRKVMYRNSNGMVFWEFGRIRKSLFYLERVRGMYLVKIKISEFREMCID